MTEISSKTIKPSVLGWMLLLWLLLWMVSASATNCRDVQSDETINDRIHQHSDKAAVLSSMQHFDRLPLEHHPAIATSYDNGNADVDLVHSASFNDKVKMKRHDFMMTGNRSLQMSSFDCVHEETEFQFAISNAPNFSSIPTRIDLCAPYILINASQPNLRGLQGIPVQNKFLEIHCNVTDSVKTCNLDAQHLSRMFHVQNSTLVFHNMNFINSDATKDMAYSSGGAFYVDFSKIEMFNCGFINNIATAGGGMLVFNSIVTIMEDDKNKTPIIIENNKAATNGGFIEAYNSSIYLQKCSIVNNTAAYGGAVAAFDSRLTLIGSDEKTSPAVIQNNFAKTSGGGFYAYNSILDISKYNIIKNSAAYGGAFDVYNTTLKLEGSNDSTMPTILENNAATVSGGVIYANANSTIMAAQGYLTFRSNVAFQRGGGAVYVRNGTSTFTNVVFENNIGKWFGGAILVTCNGTSKETSIILLKNVRLSNNTALNGAISIQETKIRKENVVFSRPGDDVDSYDLHISNLDEDDKVYRYSQINFPNEPPPQKEILLKHQKENPMQQRACVASGYELRDAVDNCNLNESGPSCSIDICGKRLQIESGSNDGINISNTNIILSCQKECPTQQCILDGMGVYRIFYGSNTNLTVRDIIFVNGFHPDNGGAIKVDRSVVTIVNSSFVNNTAPFGSAVTVNNSRLSVEGVETSIVNNTGTGPPIAVLSSQFSISNAVFADNNVSKYDSAILLYNSSVEVYNVHFVKSQGRQRRRDLAENGNVLDDCDVHVSIYADDFSRKFSCLKFANSNKSVPVVVFPDNCTASSPVSAPPTPTPCSPTICFSGDNLIEVKDFGHIQMNQLRIGDFVKSSGDKFSQVYGFGHFNHDQEGKYLRIIFDTNDKNHSPQIPESFLEISPSHLLMMEKNQNQIPIPADNVVVGDTLNGKIVIEIKTVIRRGVYAPLTQSGDIVVSGILASNYVNALDYDMNQHMLGHFMFTPQRIFCQYHMNTYDTKHVNGNYWL